jgi:hypothetical protein
MISQRVNGEEIQSVGPIMGDPREMGGGAEIGYSYSHKASIVSNLVGRSSAAEAQVDPLSGLRDRSSWTQDIANWSVWYLCCI